LISEVVRVPAQSAEGNLHHVNLSRLGEAISSIIDQLIVRFCLPPLEAGKEIHHMPIALEHHLGVVVAPVDPATPASGRTFVPRRALSPAVP
jgi:hypothetical protein